MRASIGQFRRFYSRALYRTKEPQLVLQPDNVEVAYLEVNIGPEKTSAEFMTAHGLAYKNEDAHVLVGRTGDDKYYVEIDGYRIVKNW